MSNPQNLPKLDGSLDWDTFKLAHFGPDTPTQANEQGWECDYNAESLLVTIESHFWLEGNWDQEEREDMASWLSDWAMYNAEQDEQPLEDERDTPNLGDWLRLQFGSFVDEGFYRLHADDFLVLASLATTMALLEVDRIG